MSAIVLRAPDLPEEATPALVSALVARDAFGLAFSGAVVLAGNAALQVLQALGVADNEWPDFETVAPHERSEAAATAARAAVEHRRPLMNTPDLNRANAAVQVLEATAAIHARTRSGAPESPEALRDFCGELILLGGLLGQADLMIGGPLQGILRDVTKASRQTKPPGVATVMVRWHVAARALAQTLCTANPSITSSQLAAQIDRDPATKGVSYDQVLKFIRAERKAGAVSKRQTQ